MKTLVKASIAAIALMAAPVALAKAAPQGEINYPQGALAYDQLVSGNYAEAARQLEASETLASEDPAGQINLAHAYMKLGRYNEAQLLLLAASENPESFDVVLAGGKVVDSREAARVALQRMQNRLASK